MCVRSYECIGICIYEYTFIDVAIVGEENFFLIELLLLALDFSADFVKEDEGCSL